MNESKVEEKKNIIAKKNILRGIKNIQTLMEKRKEQRSLALHNFVNQKYQNALILCRQLLFTSQKIWKEFQDEYIEEFEENYFFRTSKAKELTEYLLDCLLICRVFVKSKKKDDMLQIVDKIELPEIVIMDKDELKTKDEILRYNQIKEIQARVSAVLLSFIEICKQQKAMKESEKLFRQYVMFVKKNYGPFEYAMSEFQFGNHYYESKEYHKAIERYEVCLSIRKKNTLNDGFVDVLINLAICLRQTGRIREAISQVKVAIQISKDLGTTQEGFIDEYYLFLAKMEMQSADFMNAYKDLLLTYKIREGFVLSDPKKVQIQLNLLFFYKTLNRCLVENSEDFFNIKDKKEIQSQRKQAQEIMKLFEGNILNREQFAKYNDFNQRLAHLNLNITEQFFDELSAEQVIQLETLINKLNSCSFQKGLSQLQKSSFFEERKTRDILIAANPIIKTYSRKRN